MVMPPRLWEVNHGSAATTRRFLYDSDALGDIAERYVHGAGNTTRFLHDGDALVAEYNAGGAMLRRYMHGPGVDEPIMWDEGSAMNCSGSKFLHTNHQGSVIGVADCWGNLTAINAYDEWGIPAATNTGRFQYTGQRPR